MKRVYLTEKPDVAKQLAEFLGKPKRENGYFELPNGDVVTYAIGHLLEQAQPDHYLPQPLQGKFFAREALPLIPKTWAKEPKPERDKRGFPKKGSNGKATPMPQVAIVSKLLRSADVIVNAGDVDREGQYIADELLEYSGIPPDGSKKPVERVLIRSLDPKSLQRAIDAPRRSNGEDEFIHRRYAGECRAKADWLVGMNGSRAYSIASKTVIPIGRVRTPVAQLVVMRTLERRNFVKRDYFVPIITVNGIDLEWQARLDGGDMAGIDPAGRIVKKAVAEAILQRMLGRENITITRADVEEIKKSAPLPFSASTLQSDVGGRLGMTAKQVSKIAQTLYEKHKAISYVGTDSCYLPKSQHADAADILKGIAPVLGGLTAKAMFDKVSPCWNDNKVVAHHGIIPTGVLPAKGVLSSEEDKVYQAICRRYLSQFYPDYRYNSMIVEALAGFDTFKSSTTEVLEPGWHISEGSTPNAGQGGEKQNKRSDEDRAAPRR